MAQANQDEKSPDYDQIKSKIETLQGQLEQAETVQAVKNMEAQPMRTLLQWEAPERIHQERSRAYYVGVSLIFMLAIAFATITRETALIVALIALLALIYVSSSIKPGFVRHEITNKGIKSRNDIWTWTEIKGFWMSRRGKFDMLVVDLIPEATPNRIMMIVTTVDPKHVVDTLIPHVTYFNKSQTGEDFINTFTLGKYQPITMFGEKNHPTDESPIQLKAPTAK